MKRNVLRAIALVLAVMMLIPMMMACSDQTNTPDTPSNNTAGADNSEAGNAATVAPETTSPYDENGFLKDTLSPDLNFNN